VCRATADTELDDLYASVGHERLIVVRA